MPNAGGEPRHQQKRSVRWWRRLQCRVRGRRGTTPGLGAPLPPAGPPDAAGDGRMTRLVPPWAMPRRSPVGCLCFVPWLAPRSVTSGPPTLPSRPEHPGLPEARSTPHAGAPPRRSPTAAGLRPLIGTRPASGPAGPSPPAADASPPRASTTRPRSHDPNAWSAPPGLHVHRPLGFSSVGASP
jgi:hypothetical protein